MKVTMATARMIFFIGLLGWGQVISIGRTNFGKAKNVRNSPGIEARKHHAASKYAEGASTESTGLMTKNRPDFSGRLLNYSARWPTRSVYFFFATLALRFSSIAACAAARRATGTRNGLHET